jgi:hypothetical protein
LNCLCKNQQTPALQSFNPSLIESLSPDRTSVKIECKHHG